MIGCLPSNITCHKLQAQKEMKHKVLIVDDHALFRSGLKLLLSNSSRYEVMDEASNGIDMLRILQTETPDIILLDIAMPDMDGIDAATEAFKQFANLKIITLSMYGEEDYYFKMVGLGVKGFLLKNSDINEVFNAMDSVMDGGSYFSQELLFNLVSNLRSSNEADDQNDATLSNRELEILLEICKGQTNIEIADKLFISKRTVDKHRANILEKTQCKNTANLVVYAIKNGLVEI